MSCPPRDILSGVQSIVVVEDRVQDQRSAGSGLPDPQYFGFGLQVLPLPARFVVSDPIEC